MEPSAAEGILSVGPHPPVGENPGCRTRCTADGIASEGDVSSTRGGQKGGRTTERAPVDDRRPPERQAPNVQSWQGKEFIGCPKFDSFNDLVARSSRRYCQCRYRQRIARPGHSPGGTSEAVVQGGNATCKGDISIERKAFAVDPVCCCFSSSCGTGSEAPIGDRKRGSFTFARFKAANCRGDNSFAKATITAGKAEGNLCNTRSTDRGEKQGLPKASIDAVRENSQPRTRARKHNVNIQFDVFGGRKKKIRKA